MNQIEWLNAQGVDIFTGGNHTLDSREDIRDYLNQENSNQLRPDNIIGEDVPGTGHREFVFGDKKILVINLIGTVFMGDKSLCDNPYQRVDHILKEKKLSEYEAVLVDFHKETTSEGYAMANHLDGRVSLLWGTHTHVQTADADIWQKGLGFINDLGFAGARRSIIGVEWEAVKHRFIDDLQK
jgi:calcineurin-like phosphoesterase